MCLNTGVVLLLLFFILGGGLRPYKVNIFSWNVLEEAAANSVELHLRDLLLDGLKTDPQTCCVISLLTCLSIKITLVPAIHRG